MTPLLVFLYCKLLTLFSSVSILFSSRLLQSYLQHPLTPLSFSVLSLQMAGNTSIMALCRTAKLFALTRYPFPSSGTSSSPSLTRCFLSSSSHLIPPFLITKYFLFLFSRQVLRSVLPVSSHVPSSFSLLFLQGAPPSSSFHTTHSSSDNVYHPPLYFSYKVTPLPSPLPTSLTRYLPFLSFYPENSQEKGGEGRGAQVVGGRLVHLPPWPNP